MLDRLECYNFKSWRGRQTIGPFQDFTAVIGPNGAGKSNLMDAISFVLGVRSATLRSAALKDLIYRRGRKGKSSKAKGKEKARDDEEQDEEESDSDDEEGGDVQDEQDQDEDGAVDGERTAWVMAVYIDEDQNTWEFKRSISTDGKSDYKLNGKTTSLKKYNEQLESFNILVKAKNFLVFQGDVEAVASQSPKDLAKLIDQISGSLDLKEEYDKAAAALEKATEASVNQHSRRKGVNGEIKQYKEMQKEAEKWNSLEAEKEQATVRHLVWKLFHIEEGIKSNTEQIAEKNTKLKDVKAEHKEYESSQKAAKTELAKAQKDVGKQEKLVKKREKELEDSRPELVAIDAKISHASKKLKSAEANAKTQQTDLETNEKKLSGLQKDFDAVTKASKRHKDELAKAAKDKGFVLSDEDLKEYRELKSSANVKAVSDREALNTLRLEQKTQRDGVDAARDSLEVAQRKLEKVESEEASLLERKGTYDAKTKSIRTDLNKVRKEHDDLRQLVNQTRQTETELNEKLGECVASLQQAGADKRESDRDARFRETLANLKRTFPGVKGRVIDLCKPTQAKYGLAITTILGRNIDSVVVDNEKTAISCIEYLRAQRAGQATFIPLETIQAKSVNDKFRSFAKGARLAVDCITFDPSVEKAMQHSCGNSLVCDTMDIARHVVYDRGQEVKAVTLDGTVIHRSGLITGGTSSGQGRQFEEREVEGLRRRQGELMAKLADINKTKPRSNALDLLNAEVTRLQQESVVAQDDLDATTARLKDVQAELKVIRKSIAEYEGKVAKLSVAIEEIDDQIATHQKVVDAAEASIFSDFCKRIKVSNIREYEEKQLKTAQESNEATLKYDTQLAKLQHQLKFTSEQVESIGERVATLEETASKMRESLENLQTEKTEKSEELEAIEADIEALKASLVEYQTTLAEKSAALEDVRKQGSKSQKALDKAMKEIASCNDEIEKFGSARFAVYRRCKLDEIELPLADDSEPLDKVPIDDAGKADMDVDVEGDETQQKAAEVDDYGVVVDFEELDEEETEDGSNDKEEELKSAVDKIQEEMDKMSPNRKAIDRLGDSEARFKEIDAEFDEAREAAKAAKDAFTSLKKQRCDLFNKAYHHIADTIDDVYKDLTKGTMAPMGGVAYLSLEDSEEPYLHGIKYHAMPPMKRFRDMEQLSGGEKTMAALALLFAIHSFHPSPFFVLDEVDAALDNTNVSKLATYIKKLASPDFQFILISLKPAFFQKAQALVGVYREGGGSKNLTLDLSRYDN